MKTAHFVACILLAATPTTPSFAREVPVTISIDTFYRNCKDMGGHYIRHSETQASCSLPSGMFVLCNFATNVCIVDREAPGNDGLKLLLGDIGPATVDPGPRNVPLKSLDGGASTMK
jgi:hypothetical protein